MKGMWSIVLHLIDLGEIIYFINNEITKSNKLSRTRQDKINK